MAWRDLFRWVGRKSGSATNSLELFREIYGTGRVSLAGKTVTLENALRVASAFGCGRVIGNGVAQVPLKLMREASGRRLPARDHPLYEILALKPNPWQTSFEFRTMMSFHVEFCGNFYAFKNAPAGQVRELIPFEPGRVRVERGQDLSLKYFVRSEDGATEKEYPAAAMWHVRGPSWTSWIGMEWLQIAREALGLSMAAEESQAKLHANGVQTAGTYSVDRKLNEEQYKQLRQWLIEEHAGAKAGGPMLLDSGATWTSTQMKSVDAQHIETRKMQVEEVCRFFGVMPIMVGYSDKASTYASSEQMFLAHVIHTLSPRWTMYEQSMDANLLTQKEREAGYYFDFVEEGMIRGAVKDTQAAITGYIAGGVMTQNEGRAKLDLNPDPDPESDKLHLPVNLLQPEAPDEEAAATRKAIQELRAEVKALAARPPMEIHHHNTIDAKTTLEEGAVQTKVEAPVHSSMHMDPGAIRLEAPVSISTEVQPAAPVVKAYPSETEETVTRDDAGEIKTVLRRAKD